MTTGTNELLEKALALPPRERVAFANKLLDTVDDPDQRRAWEAEWAEEIDRRLETERSGEEVGQDWDEALAEMRLNISRPSTP